MTRFRDRREAGQQLARKLRAYQDCADAVVLGIPRGGIVVAAEIAFALRTPLDVFIAHKIGAPFNEELAIGAIAGDGTVFLDNALIRELRLPEDRVRQARETQLREIERRANLYRRDRAPLQLQDKIVIVADDGVATGATTMATLRALRRQNPARLMLAVPVAPRQVVPLLRAECDELIVLEAPEPFVAVGYFYEDFEQVTDEQVIAYLANQQ